MLVLYKFGIARLGMSIVEFSILLPGWNSDWQIDNKESENLFICENGRNEEAELQDVKDENDLR